MMIKMNGKYGAKVGNIQVFTREGAINAYKTFVKVCYKDLSLESSSVLTDVEADMRKLGFTPEELEEIEIATIAAA